MAAPLPSNDCDRARALVSAWLDGELSELGRARLDAHLAECKACRVYQRDAQGATQLLRSATLQELGVPIVLPRARHRLARIAQTGSAAAAAAAVAVLALTGTLSRHTSEPAVAVLPNAQQTQAQTPNLDFRLLRDVRLSRTNAARVTARLAQ